MATFRDWHWTDEALDSGGMNRRRTIANWSNWKDRAGEFRKTELRMRAADPGDEFLGMDLQYVGDRAPMQFFVGNPADAGGRPWWGCRKSDSDKGILYFVENGTVGTRTVNAAAKRITYEDTLPDTDLVLLAGVARLSKWLALNTATAGDGGAGNRVDLGIVIPPGWSLEVIGSGEARSSLSFRNKNGVEVYRSAPARALDSSTLGPDGGPRQVPCTFIALPDGVLGGIYYKRVRVRCQPAGFTRPILMDPDTTITGATAVDDTYVHQYYPDYNWGGVDFAYTSNDSGAKRKILIRIVNPAVIPSGVIASCVLSIVRRDDNTATTWWRISDANAWVEGRGSGAALDGETTWNKLQHGTPGVAWAGSAGCSTAGTDYVNTLIGSLSAGPGGTSYSRVDIAIDVAVPTYWRDHAVSNGVLGLGNSYLRMKTNEHVDAGTDPQWVISYYASADGCHKVLDARMRARFVSVQLEPIGI